MTEPQAITSDDLRALLGTSSPDSILALIEGRVVVIDEGEVDADTYKGALTVISRGELMERLDGDTDKAALDAQADALSTAVQQLGG